MRTKWKKMKRALEYFFSGDFFRNLDITCSRYVRKPIKPHRPLKSYFILADKTMTNKEYYQEKHDREMAEIQDLVDRALKDPDPAPKYLEDYIRNMVAEGEKRKKKKEKITARIWISAVAAVFVCVMISTNTFSIKDHLTGFVVTVYEKFSTITRPKDDPDSYPGMILQCYEPAYLPEGYAFQSEKIVDTRREVKYSNGADTIFFLQRAIDGAGINTEEAEPKDILVNGQKGVYYEYKGEKKMVWEDGEYRFWISGPVCKETLLKMAESLVIQE